MVNLLCIDRDDSLKSVGISRGQGQPRFNTGMDGTVDNFLNEPNSGIFLNSGKVAGWLEFTQNVATEIEFFPFNDWSFIL